MNNEQLEEIMKNAQRVQEQLEKSGALKAIEVMNNNPSIKWAIKEVQNLERSGILETMNEYSKMYQEFEKLLESIGTKTIESLTNISLPVADSIHRELCRLGESTYFQCRHELNALFKNTNVLESINQLRQKIPAYFLYEHQDSNFYTEDVYNPLFQESEEWKLEVSDDTSGSLLTNPKEVDLLKHIGAFEKVVLDAALNKAPFKITNYLYTLASLFHTFYNECKVIDKENEELTSQRVVLAKMTRITIKNGLKLIGVEALNKM